ncbi:MAG: GatB/YqeY domain-containing protein [Thermomicrobiales bacterium]|nr:GatB/YqeY domain-containing protein [Thermomicrobiales bacterium]
MSEVTLEAQLQDDLKNAMRSGDTVARDTIRYTMSSLKNARIDKGADLTAQEAITVLQRDAKRRQESIDQFRSGGRNDLVEKEEAQLAVLERYLPAALSDDEVETLVRDAIAETGASEPKDLGKLMPLLIQRAAGRSDGKRLNEAARKALTPS